MLQTFLSDDRLRSLLEQARTIAIVGAKDKPGQPVDSVGRYLVQAGYKVVPVHPVRKDVWGLPTYQVLSDIPFAVDIVDVFRAPEYCAGHAREALQLSPLPHVFWMQLGITSPEAVQIAGDAGMVVVEDSCLSVTHQRLFGKDSPSDAKNGRRA